MPIVKLKIGLHETGKNEVIKILAYDPDFEEDVKQWCINTGNIFLYQEKDGGIIKAFIKKSA